MKPQEKKNLIAQLLEYYVRGGYDITEFIGKPLSYFDYEAIANRIEKFEEEIRKEEEEDYQY